MGDKWYELTDTGTWMPPSQADQFRRDLAASRAECERLRGAMERACLVIGKGRCTCTESETAMHLLSAALAALAGDAGKND